MPRLVAPGELAPANARLEGARAVGQVAGPGLGGALVQALTGPIALGMAAIACAVSVAALLDVRTVRPAPRAAAAAGGGAAGMRAGLVWLARMPLLRAVAACTATANLFGTMSAAVYVLFAVRDVGLTPLLLGFVYAVRSAGGLVGGSLAPAWARRLGSAGLMRAGAVVFTLGPLAVPLAPRQPGLAAALLGGAGAAQALGRSAYTVTQVSLRQRLAPPALLGRVNAAMRLLGWVGLPVGFAAGGFLGARLGVVDTLWISGGGGLLALGWLARSAGRIGIRPNPAPAA